MTNAQLVAKWERFFTLANLEWRSVVRLESGFDFTLTLPCSHSECAGFHILGVRVLENPRETLGRKHDEWYTMDEIWNEPHPALFGDGPKNTWWQMGHGSGGCIWSLDGWLPGADSLWERAAAKEHSYVM
jgi:hypothetical protein